MTTSEKVDFAYPSGFKFALLMISIFIGMFLVALVCYMTQGDLLSCQCIHMLTDELPL